MAAIGLAYGTDVLVLLCLVFNHSPNQSIKIYVVPLLAFIAHTSRVSRQLVYRHFVYDTSSTDISSTDISSTMTFLAEIEAGMMKQILYQ